MEGRIKRLQELNKFIRRQKTTEEEAERLPEGTGTVIAAAGEIR